MKLDGISSDYLSEYIADLLTDWAIECDNLHNKEVFAREFGYLSQGLQK